MTVCTVHLLSQIKVGHTLVIAGILDVDWNFVKIIFTREEEEQDSFCIEIKKNSIILSSLINHVSTNEQQIECDEEFADNLKFKLYILTFDEKISIALNDKFLCYYYQKKLSSMRIVKVVGDVFRVQQVDHRTVFPKVFPLLQHDLPSVAFSSDVPCSFSENSVIVIRAILKGNAEKGSFFIRFNEQGSKRQLFHFNPRFDEKCIVVNAMNDSLDWCFEERFHQGSHNFPFEIEREFQLAIFFDTDCFRIAKDGSHLLSYRFKIPQTTQLKVNSQTHPIYEKLTGFKIFGQSGLDVIVNLVDFFEINYSDSKFYEMFSNKNFI